MFVNSYFNYICSLHTFPKIETFYKYIPLKYIYSMKTELNLKTLHYQDIIQRSTIKIGFHYAMNHNIFGTNMMYIAYNKIIYIVHKLYTKYINYGISKLLKAFTLVSGNHKCSYSVIISII